MTHGTTVDGAAGKHLTKLDTEYGCDRLLFFVTEDWYFLSHRLDLAKAAKCAGYEVYLVTNINGCEHQIREAGIHIIPLKLYRRSLNPFLILTSVIRLIKIYRDVRPTLVHHIAILPMLIGSLAAKLSGVTHIVNSLNGLGWAFSSNMPIAKMLSFGLRISMRALLSNSPVIVQNLEDAQFLRDLGISNNHIYLIPGSGIDTNRFSPSDQSPETPIVILPARLLWQKGIDEFVKAACILKQRGRIARFVLLGCPDIGNPDTVTEDLLLKWEFDGVIEWWGFRSDMPNILRSVHVVCLPSYYREGVPKSLLEAISSGLPIVTTDTPGCRDVVINEENGILIPVKNPRALADAIDRLLGDSALRVRMGINGRNRAITLFSKERICDATLDIYRSITIRGP
jgi:glycosyltransferase involved in cell wall biosynthesis